MTARDDYPILALMARLEGGGDTATQARAALAEIDRLRTDIIWFEMLLNEAHHS